MRRNSKQIVSEIILIVSLSVMVALIYNHFSDKGISIIRKEIKNTGVPDSALFAPAESKIVTANARTSDTAAPENIKVIAPLHAQALRNQDSMAQLYKNKKGPVYNIITLQQLSRLLSERRGYLIDARNKDDYQKGHIKGAHNIPALEAEKYFGHFVSVPRDTLVIIYCNNDECHLAHTLADLLMQFEFKKIYIYGRGWDGWIEAKMPVDTAAEKD